MGRRTNTALVAERVRRLSKKLGVLPLDEKLDREAKEVRIRFGSAVPANSLRAALIKARISAAQVNGPISSAVIIHLDAAEERQPYTHRPRRDDEDEAA